MASMESVDIEIVATRATTPIREKSMESVTVKIVTTFRNRTPKKIPWSGSDTLE